MEQNTIYNLKHIQLEIAHLLKSNCKSVYINDGYGINVVI